MFDGTAEMFLFPAVGCKNVTAGLDGNRITFDGGVLLLAAAECRLGIADRLAELIAGHRSLLFVTHGVADVLRAHMLAIACGYEDAGDLDHLRTDPGFKLACGACRTAAEPHAHGRLRRAGKAHPACAQMVRLSCAMVDAYRASSARPPKAATLDIDDTVDVVHGHQQSCLFVARWRATDNALHDERCFMPIHVYDAATSARSQSRCGLAKRRPGTRSAARWGAWCAASGSIDPARR